MTDRALAFSYGRKLAHCKRAFEKVVSLLEEGDVEEAKRVAGCYTDDRIYPRYDETERALGVRA